MMMKAMTTMMMTSMMAMKAMTMIVDIQVELYNMQGVTAGTELDK